jgi:hypothetical protein
VERLCSSALECPPRSWWIISRTEALDDFPGVTREQAIVFLLQAAEALLERIGAPLPLLMSPAE